MKRNRHASTPKTDELAEGVYKGVDSRADFLNRRIYLVGEVDEDTVARFLMGFHMMDSGSGTIEVVICSGGGKDYSGLAIYDALRLSKNKVVAKVYGEVMSIAVLCLQGADVRLVAPTVRCMIHNGHWSTPQEELTYQELQAEAKEYTVCNNTYYEVLSERSGLSVDRLRDMCARETFMSAKTMVNLGLADGMIPFQKGIDNKGKKTVRSKK